MKNFTCIEGGALRVKGTTLYVLPYYKTNKTDPNIRSVLRLNLEESLKSEILSDHSTGDIIKIQAQTKTAYWLLCLSEGISDFALAAALNNVLSHIEASNHKSIVIGQLGLIEYGCENEEKWKRKQNSLMEAFANSHPGTLMTMVIPGDDYRPLEGNHFGDGIIPEDKEDTDPKDIPQLSSHHQIALNTRIMKSYVDYFSSYIDAREKQYEIIYSYSGNNISNLKDLQTELKEFENRDRVESFAKWSHDTSKKQKKKWSKRKSGNYCPVPSKQKLKLIIMLLDMNYDEAVACLNFFGYGLARFDKQDQAFTYIIKGGLDSDSNPTWPRPINIKMADETLRHRFGNSAGLLQKKKQKK